MSDRDWICQEMWSAMKRSTEHQASEVALGKQGCASKLLIQKETEQASAADASFELNSCQWHIVPSHQHLKRNRAA